MNIQCTCAQGEKLSHEMGEHSWKQCWRSALVSSRGIGQQGSAGFRLFKTKERIRKSHCKVGASEKELGIKGLRKHLGKARGYFCKSSSFYNQTVKLAMKQTTLYYTIVSEKFTSSPNK